MITRRQFAASTPLLAASALALPACSWEPAADGYEAVAERTWQPGALTGLGGTARGRELVRFATLAPSSHNTQCWKFAQGANGRSISILPDLARRCPAVDPDDHHVFVSLGCAAQNLVQAALAHGLKGEAQFDAFGDAVRVMLEPTRAQATPLLTAIPLRQCTRGDHDGKALSGEQRSLLQRAGSSQAVRLLPLTERPAIEQTFVGPAADKAHWVEVGRCYDRFALQATSLGIRNACLNQPVEVAALRPLFAAALGLSGQRPDLGVRFGRGAAMPRSLRRPVDAVLV